MFTVFLDGQEDARGILTQISSFRLSLNALLRVNSYLASEFPILGKVFSSPFGSDEAAIRAWGPLF